MTVSTSSVQLSPEDSGKILADVATTSAVLALSDTIDLGVTGSTFHTFGRTPVGIRSEGEAMVVRNAEIVKREIATRNFYALVTETKELQDAHTVLARKVFDVVPPQVAGALDRAVLGLQFTADERGANFDSFEDAETVEVTDRSTLIAALGATGNPTGILATSAFIWQLAALSDTTGHALFPGLAVNSTDLGGIALRVVPSSESVAVAGDFKNWAVAGVNKSVSVEYFTEAVLPDGNGGEINLAAERKIAGMAEARYGFRIADLSKFRKLTVGTAPVAGE